MLGITAFYVVAYFSSFTISCTRCLLTTDNMALVILAVFTIQSARCRCEEGFVDGSKEVAGESGEGVWNGG